MKNVKELFNNARTKVKESKIVTVTKGFFGKITNNKIINSIKAKTTSFKEMIKIFTGSHQNVKDCMAGDVSNRFSKKAKKVFKDTVNNIQKKANDGRKFSKFMAVTIKVLAIIAAIGFAALVIYCIKDVFLYCLMLVATCAAVAICIEFILSILSIATGCRI